MHSFPALKRCLLGVVTLAIFAVVLAVVWWQRPMDADEKAKAGVWPLFGGTVQRNMVNLTERNIATDWSVEPGQGKTNQMGR